MYTIIDTLYGNNVASSDSLNANAVETVARVYAIETQLSDWQRSLPLEMKLISIQDLSPSHLPPDHDPTGQLWKELRLRFVITLRYINLRILLHRPVLVKFLDGAENTHDSQDTSFLQQVGSNSIQIANQSAKELICLVHDVIEAPARSKKRGLPGAWWFSLYYSKCTMRRCIINANCHLSIQCSIGSGDVHAYQYRPERHWQSVKSGIGRFDPGYFITSGNGN